MKPLYKVGDKVLIKSQYDKNCTACDYRYGFARDMLEDYGGKVLTVSKIFQSTNTYYYRIPDDGYKYYCKECIYNWVWTSGMFELEF